MGKLKKCCENMAANADLYRRIAKTKEMQGDSAQEAIAKAQAAAWQEASDMLADAMAGGKG